MGKFRRTDNMPAVPPAVSAVGYFPKGEEKYPHGDIDSIVWIVFARYKANWKVMSIWLSREAAVKAAKKYKQRETKLVSVLVPGLLYTAVAKLRTAE